MSVFDRREIVRTSPSWMMLVPQSADSAEQVSSRSSSGFQFHVAGQSLSCLVCSNIAHAAIREGESNEEQVTGSKVWLRTRENPSLVEDD